MLIFVRIFFFPLPPSAISRERESVARTTPNVGRSEETEDLWPSDTRIPQRLCHACL